MFNFNFFTLCLKSNLSCGLCMTLYFEICSWLFTVVCLSICSSYLLLFIHAPNQAQQSISNHTIPVTMLQMQDSRQKRPDPPKVNKIKAKHANGCTFAHYGSRCKENVANNRWLTTSERVLS